MGLSEYLFRYGAVLITVLMGSGLVSLPRRLWQLSNPEMELNCLYITVIDSDIVLNIHQCIFNCFIIRLFKWKMLIRRLVLSWRMRNWM